MVNNDPVPFFETSQALALFHNHTAGFMACHHTGDIAFRPFSHMFPVNTADIAAADGGRLRLNQHLSVSGLGDLHIFHFHRAVAGQRRPSHSHFFHCRTPFLIKNNF